MARGRRGRRPWSQPSPTRAARRSAASPCPPIRIGKGSLGTGAILRAGEVVSLAVVLDVAARREAPDDVDRSSILAPRRAKGNAQTS